MGVAPQLRWRLIIKPNSGLSASAGAQDSLAEPYLGPGLVGLWDTMGKSEAVGLKKESCLDILKW